MADQEKKPLDIDTLEATELEDEALEGVAGGVGAETNSCPIIINNVKGCGSPSS